MIKRLLHTRYRVNDLEKTAHLLPRCLRPEGSRAGTPRRAARPSSFFNAPGSEEQIEICHYPKSGPVQVQPDLTHLAFEVDDLEAFAKEADGEGLSAERRPDRDQFRQQNRFH